MVCKFLKLPIIFPIIRWVWDEKKVLQGGEIYFRLTRKNRTSTNLKTVRLFEHRYRTKPIGRNKNLTEQTKIAFSVVLLFHFLLITRLVFFDIFDYIGTRTVYASS